MTVGRLYVHLSWLSYTTNVVHDNPRQWHAQQ
jgi:hypothetical protein